MVIPLVLAWVGWVLVAMIAKGEPPRMPAPPLSVGWTVFAIIMGFWLYRIVVDLIG